MIKFYAKHSCVKIDWTINLFQCLIINCKHFSQPKMVINLKNSSIVKIILQTANFNLAEIKLFLSKPSEEILYKSIGKVENIDFQGLTKGMYVIKINVQDDIKI